MAHFAKLDDNNVVLQVHVVHNNELLDDNGQESEAKGIEFLTSWSGGHTNWKQTSYNKSFRKNFAGIGFTYDPVRDAFLYPKPFPSWVLNEDTCMWEAPVPQPENGLMMNWDEDNQAWVEVPNGA